MKKLNPIVFNKKEIETKDILSKSDLKNIVGGVDSYGGSMTFKCINAKTDGSIHETSCFLSFTSAMAYCDVYKAMNLQCRCSNC